MIYKEKQKILSRINRKLLTFAGPRAWTTQEVITLCERLAGQDANVTTVPVSVLRVTRQLTRFFQWTNDVADRLAFTEVLSSDMVTLEARLLQQHIEETKGSKGTIQAIRRLLLSPDLVVS